MPKREQLVDLLEELTALNGPSGHEDAVRAAIMAHIADHAECKVDALGNIIAFKKGKERPACQLMLDAHMDEVGVMITSIRADGLLCFATVGGITPESLLGKTVRFDRAEGVIGCTPIHLLEGDQKDNMPAVDKMYIDIGADDRAEAETLVAPGDVGTFISRFVRFGDGFIKAKAIDDRAGCAVLIDMICRDQPYDMTFTFSTREEVGLVGAKTVAAQVAPDVALVLESTTAGDTVGSAAGNQVCVLGQGTVLSIKDNATLYDKTLFDWILRKANTAGIACQVKQAVAGGNNAGAIHASGSGVRTAALSLPCRYLHSASSVIAEKDLFVTARLASHLANEICAGRLEPLV